MNILRENKNLIASLALGVGLAVMVPVGVYAATTADSQLTQEIDAGVLSTDIVDASGESVASPSFAMGGVSVSNSQQTSTGTFGSDSQRVAVDNAGDASNGWTLTWNATNPGTTQWVSGSDSYAYNGSAATGQLTVNPSAGTLTAVVGGSTGVTLGAEASFTGTDAVTLMTADASADTIWNGYVTGVSLSQAVPASTPAGNYSIDMTQTITAN